MRPQDWPSLLEGYVEQSRRAPFAWGTHDCVTFTCGWFRLMTGRDAFAPFRGKYATENEAHRLMIANDVHGMEEAGRFLFGEPRKGNAHLQRGDLVYAEGALGICVGAKSVFLNEEGLTFLRHDKLELGWSV